jgi:phosphoribosylformylglycinamidine synthase
MAACAVDTAIRNVVAVGADLAHLALLDNFCWCSSDEPERLGQLKRAAQACYDYAVAYGTPFISGKDSMFNDFKGYDERGAEVKISVLPTLLISSIGVLADVAKTVSLDAKFPGDLVYVLGETFEELGASEYFAMWNDRTGQRCIGKTVPRVDATNNQNLYRAFFDCVQDGLIASAQSITRGGLAIALSKMAMGGLLGMEISLENLPGEASRDDYALYSESQGRIVATINPKNREAFEDRMRDVPCTQIGTVKEDHNILIKGLKGKLVIHTSLEAALQSYKSTFEDY